MVAEHREIALPNDIVINGIRGYFGRVNVDTHLHYENRPAPGVIAQRICKDLRYTEEGDREWNLHADLQPKDDDAE